MQILEENEKKKEFLNGYRACVRREMQLAQQIKELRQRKMFPGMNTDGMPKGNVCSDLSGYVAQLDDLISQLEHEREIAVRRYKEIHDQISAMGNSAEKEVLVRYYLLEERWEVIAVRMNYTYRHVTRLHGKALRNFCLPEKMS